MCRLMQDKEIKTQYNYHALSHIDVTVLKDIHSVAGEIRKENKINHSFIFLSQFNLSALKIPLKYFFLVFIIPFTCFYIKHPNNCVLAKQRSKQSELV